MAAAKTRLMNRRINTNPWFDLMNRKRTYPEPWVGPDRLLWECWPRQHMQKYDKMLRSPWPGIAIESIFALFRRWLDHPEEALMIGKGPILPDAEGKEKPSIPRDLYPRRKTLQFILSLNQKQIETCVILMTLAETL